ncbi:MAG: malto-oligosyltrehalose synthase [Chloroflexota bacterium]|nr:malto-oligosyltrehalose synthase [Chloroflexota bacterium]
MGEEKSVVGVGVAADDLSARIPSATYRLQFRREFTFRDAERIVPYLADLGVDTLYASPIFRANPGSSHGYDVVDYSQLNPELGDVGDFDRLVAALRQRGMGLLLDTVPNHMGIGQGRNRWWQNVLENGPSSPYAEVFDIAWSSDSPDRTDRVLLPMLGDQYGTVLERGELQLRVEEGAFAIAYFETPLPIAPPTYPLILRQSLDAVAEAVPGDDPHLTELQSVITAFERLPSQTATDPAAVEERQREQLIAKRRLAEVMQASTAVRRAIDDAVKSFNGVPGNPSSFDLLDQLLTAQSYRLAFWRVAEEEINYRRFFAINELAAIRQELPHVFAATHELLLGLIASGQVTGVRVDHPDGLWDPAGYVRALQEAVATARGGAPETSSPSAIAPASLPLYLVVEKILEHGEPLPESWAVHGTVGYEFMTAATGLLVDGANRRAFDDIYRRFAGETVSLPDLVYACKQMMLRTAFVSEMNVLAQALDRISEMDRHTRDFTLNTLRDALREIIACFPVYRTYVSCEAGTVSDRDRRYVEAAIARAKRRNPTMESSVFDFVADVLLLRASETVTPVQWLERCQFTMRVQQLTGPAMAKGLEDTAFYRYNRLTSLNEVGGDPGRFGTGVADFHQQNQERLDRWPHALLASSTHDTKRGEDVRARISVLSEMPQSWRAAIGRWRRLNRRHKTTIDGRLAPSRNDEYLLYQTLLGVWPGASAADGDLTGRITAYMEKVTREAQVETTWTNPNDEYESAVRRFVEAILDPKTGGPFLAEAISLRQIVAHLGAINALTQQVLKLTAPGVPDIYQGTELWDLSLVDPDNRRPVDFALRARTLRALRRRQVGPRLTAELLKEKTDGRIKLFVTQCALAYRQERPHLFREGSYLPLAATGGPGEMAATHIVAFARRGEEPADEVIVVVPRLIGGLCPDAASLPLGSNVWGDATLAVPDAAPGSAYRNIFTGEEISLDEAPSGLPLAEVFATFPVAILARI